MNKFKFMLFALSLVVLFSCTSTSTKKAEIKKGYLKDNISQAELYNPVNYKRYFYSCYNAGTGLYTSLMSYFPLSRESRLKDNFGFYFQLDGGTVQPFDHIENKALNARGSKFEVIYRSYNPIEGSYIDLIAREHRSIYYKNYNGVKVPWLECREA
ncbi:hypothetical protein [Necropsobacter massiliensis]|uniref:hypothetical protein n=1 Tax=Necropsobacter massiliensis TaxID=1400001 RepID=UPI000595A284|nr:hypothetical protein [Necropsobacter massiliensis]